MTRRTSSPVAGAVPVSPVPAALLGDRPLPRDRGRGLDPDYLAGLRHPRHDVELIGRRIRAHLDEHDGYVAFSGGKDSLVTLHLALQVEPNVPVVFFDSGLEFPETYFYLEHLQDTLDVDVQVIPARHTTLEVLAASGAWDHRAPRGAVPDLHRVLITEPAALAHDQHGPGELWGVRAQESRGRAALYANALRAETGAHCSSSCPHPATTTGTRSHHGGLVRRVDGTTALGPVWDWTTTEVWGYLSRHDLPINPVYAKLRSLGAPEHALRISHVLDGSRLEDGRLTWLRRGWPTLFNALVEALPRLREFV